MLLYIVACCTKHVNSYGCLLFGRLLGGVSTSLLLTVFDAWLACEHRVRGFEPELLQRICGAQTFGNSLVAIGAGVIAQALVGRFPLLRWGDGAAARSDGSELEQVFEDAHEPGVYFGGLTAPFDLAVIALACGGVCLQSQWSENYGYSTGPSDAAPSDTAQAASAAGAAHAADATADAAAVAAVEPLLLAAKALSPPLALAAAEHASPAAAAFPAPPRCCAVADSFARGAGRAVATVRGDARVALTGTVLALFEGAMYTFIFGWTPALTPAADARDRDDAGETAVAGIPHGTVFATFMLCCMAGSQLHAPLLAACGGRPERVLVRVCAAGALGLGVAALQPEPGSALACVRRRLVSRARATLRSWPRPARAPRLARSYGGFLVFEACVGAYFPSMFMVKSRVVPEASRAAIYNLFRVPLNAIVLFVLLNTMPVRATFGLCAGLLALAACVQARLVVLLRPDR